MNGSDNILSIAPSRMRILFATTHKHLPELRGGMEVNTHELIHALQKRGITAGVLCGLAGIGWVGLSARLKMKLLGQTAPRDSVLGYSCWRSWNSVADVAHVVRAFRPDAIVIQGGADFDPLLKACLATGLPTCCYLHTQDKLPIAPALRDNPLLTFIANSEFTASLHDDKRISAIVRPLIRPAAYLTQTDRSAVVFVNPTPHKGLDIVLKLASARRDIPFLFVANQPAAAIAIKRQVADLGLGNIEVVGPFADMRMAYKHAKLVVAPSQAYETWGRIATEAHFNGIPVLASDRGGLSEAVGPAGLCLPADAPADSWLAALSAMWDEPQRYAVLAAAALDYAKRREIDADFIVDTFVESLRASPSAMVRPAATHAGHR